MQEKIQTVIDRFGDVIGNALISIGAALVRLFFLSGKTFRESLVTFGGGIIFGILVGYLIKPVPWLESYSPALIAFSAMAGKEIFTAIIKRTPEIVGDILSYLSRKRNDSNNSDNNSNSV